MSKLAKLIERILREPSELNYEDVYYILTKFDFQEVSSKGSHHTLRNKAGLKITIPKKGGKMVKRIYLKQIVSLLGLEEWKDES